ncbi:MAG: hypothetical protein EAZ52_06685 [Alphaproteobacteria bacterium]|nr:MAG: hypothetical protein EAZ52_06685 [Alphaproteobacteria bacterium]
MVRCVYVRCEIIKKYIPLDDLGSSMISLQQSFSAHTLNNHLKRTSTSLQNTINQLSSGSRVGHTHHAESIYHISSRFKLHEMNHKHSAKNMAAASSMLSAVDNGLAQIDEIVMRMQFLAETAKNSTITHAERNALSVELQTLSDEIDRISLNTQFGGINLLDGGAAARRLNEGSVATMRSDATAATLLGGTLGLGGRTVIGSSGADLLYGLEGGTVFEAGAGGAGLQGLIYDPLDPWQGVNNMTEARSAIADPANLLVTFRSTGLSYSTPGGLTYISTFLGADNASVSNTVTASATDFEHLALVFRGSLIVQNAGTYDFRVTSDDGFALNIGGNTFMQYHDGRVGSSDGSITLTAGLHYFELIYFERGGGEELFVESNLGGGAMQIMNSSHFLMAGTGSDGDDTMIGGVNDYDVARYSGNIEDYRITRISSNEYIVEDMRSGSTHGRDVLRNIDLVQFANNEYILSSNSAARNLDFHSEDALRGPLSYEILDTSTRRLFARSPAMSLDDAAQAATTQRTLEDASSRIAFLRNYVNNLHMESEVRYEQSMRAMHSMEQIDSTLFDTDFTKTSSEYTQELMKTNSNVLMRVQTHNMQQNILRLIND